MELSDQLKNLSTHELTLLLEKSGHSNLLNRKELAIKEKEKGNVFFLNGEFVHALESYTKAIEFDESCGILYSNRAAVYIKLGKYDNAIQDCNRSLSFNVSIKAHLRRATAFLFLGEFSKAFHDFDASLRIEPCHKEALQGIRKTREEIQNKRLCDPSIQQVVFQTSILLARITWQHPKVFGNPSPPPLNGHRSVAMGNVVWLYGGRSTSRELTDLYSLDTSTLSWKHIPVTSENSPSHCAWHSMTRYLHYFLVFGGVSSRGESNCLHVFNSKNLQWYTPETTGDRPSPRSSHSMTYDCDQNIFYLFGGRGRQGVLNDMYTLSFTSFQDTWRWNKIKEQSSLPSPRDGHSLDSVQLKNGKTVFILFGGNGKLSGDKMNDLWVFHPTTCVWQEIHPTGMIPIARSYHIAKVVENCLLVYGGRATHEELCSIHILNTEIWNWQVVQPVGIPSTPRSWHTSSLIGNNQIYIYGGGTGPTALSDVVVLDLGQLPEFLNEDRQHCIENNSDYQDEETVSNILGKDVSTKNSNSQLC